jgi:hypothetical protein
MGDRAIGAFELTRAMAEAEVAIAELHIPPLVIALVMRRQCQKWL